MVMRTCVRWEPEGATFMVGAGERLIDALDDHPSLRLPTACRAANCGTCRVRVQSGSAGVVPAGDWEVSVLTLCGAAPDERLGCQLCFSNDTRGEVGEAGEVVLVRLP